MSQSGSSASRLLQAVGDNDLDAARECIAAGEAPSERAMEVALAYAFDVGTAMLRLLVEVGGLVNARDRDFGSTPLMHAARGGDLTLVEELLRRGADISARDAEERTALDWAIQAGRYSVVRHLHPEPLDEASVRTMLAGAVALDTTEELAALLAAFPALVPERPALVAAWIGAARAGDLERSRYLGAQISPPAGLEERGAALVAAAGEARTELVVALLSMEQSQARLGEALCQAARFGTRAAFRAYEPRSAEEIVRRLLAAGADPNHALPNTGETPLMSAARHHDLPILELLLAHGADVHARDPAGRTAMAYANQLPEWPAPGAIGPAKALLARYGGVEQAWIPYDPPPGTSRPSAPSSGGTLHLASFVLALLLLLFAALILWATRKG